MATGTANPILSLEVVPKIEVSSVDTAFAHLVSGTLNIVTREVENATPGTSGWVQRNVEFLDWNATVTVRVVATTIDPPIGELFTHLMAGTKPTFNFAETAGNKNFEGTPTVQFAGSINLGSHYEHTWTLNGSGALTMTTAS